jgi:pyridinium-3,5-bisthiocarboxylic acid mononucleotide nickel chelatase
MHIHLDPVGGIAGDMFIAALLDAWPELAPVMVEAIHAAGFPEAVKIKVWRDRDAILMGTRFKVEEKSPSPESAERHVHFRDIRTMLLSSALPSLVAERAVDIFTILAEAEARVHGVPTDAVAFHEIGAADSIADIVGAAFLIETLNAKAWSCGALPLGSGRVQTAHGLLPVPAPAVTSLLVGFPVFQDGIEGERVTPTGAAILRHLDPDFVFLRSPMRLSRSGVGLGSRTFPGISNMLRVLISEQLNASVLQEDVAVMQFEVDDQTPEDLAIGLDTVRAQAGVLDVVQATVLGKKGRMAVQVQILVKPEAVDSVASVCFSETSTIGLRWQRAHRITLPRRSERVLIDNQTIHVKCVERPGGKVTSKAAADDVAQVKGGRVERTLVRRKAEDASVLPGLDDD